MPLPTELQLGGMEVSQVSLGELRGGKQRSLISLQQGIST